jgi:hypothetical protein
MKKSIESERNPYSSDSIMPSFWSRYQYFEDVVHNSSIFLDDSKKQLDASLKKIQILESELEIWKNNCLAYEQLSR